MAFGSYDTGRKRCTKYELIQFFILVFTMSLMLSKHFTIFHDLFSFLYESEFSMICVVVGAFSIGHGFFMMYKAFTTGEH